MTTEKKTCATCKHMRLRTEKDKNIESGWKLTKFWCDKLGIGTRGTALRCGGDDYEAK